MDLDPFEPIGIATQTMRFLDVFLLHCLLSDSPPDTPAEIAALVRNQGQVAERGREPGFCIERQGQQVELVEWADRILSEMRPIAQRLDAVAGKETSNAAGLHCAALDHAIDTLHHPEKLPAARVLASMQNDFGGSFGRFGLAQAQRLKASAAAAPLTAAQTLAMRPSRVPLHCAKNKFNKVNRYKFEVIVNSSNMLAKLTSEQVDCKEGAPGSMRNLYLYKKIAYGRPSHAASGLQPFQRQDVSTVPGCINRVLRSTLR